MDEWNKGLVAHLGIRIVEIGPDRVVGELDVRDELKTTTAAVHGGTLMALADTVGGTAAMLNLPPGASTATIESKTNFFAAGKNGVVRAGLEETHAQVRSEQAFPHVVDGVRVHSCVGMRSGCCNHAASCSSCWCSSSHSPSICASSRAR